MPSVSENGIWFSNVAGSTVAVGSEIPMVPVAGGTFFNGKANMTVGGFLMGAYDVTQAQYREVMGTNPSFYAGKLGYPVESISWYQTLVFCNLRSLREGLAPAFSIGGSPLPDQWGPVPTTLEPVWDAATMDLGANGYRLPTACEWLWAAMGGPRDGQPGNLNGNLDALGYTKPFAGFNGTNHMEDYAHSGPCTVGTTKYPNELGLYDMSGNVGQWCWDTYANLPATPEIDYLGCPSLGYRTIYGYAYPRYSTLISQSMGKASAGDSSVGFRVVRSVR